jgi:thiamine biosynthesis lipoprotein
MPVTARPAPAEPLLVETGFAAMGSQVHIAAFDAPTDVLSHGRAAIGVLERYWSRFRPDSEVSRINAAGGRPVTVSTTTATLIALAVRGWATTDGAYDPTVLDAVIGAGYDRSFELIATADPGPAAVAGPAPGCAGIAVDVDSGLVRLPAGVHIDPGGIGKGLAADLVATALVADGAGGALVNVGGDVRVAGAAPPGGWRIDIDLPAVTDTQLTLRSGGVATSGTHRRRWVRDGSPRHHLIDPRSGVPATSPFVAATVVAGTAWHAEVLTKAVLLARTVAAATQVLAAADGAGLLIDADGRAHELAGVGRFRP